MTAKELNTEIKNLIKLQNEDEKIFRAEFIRLYHADSSFELMSKSSVLIMLRLNLRYRIIQLHSFGIMINLENL